MSGFDVLALSVIGLAAAMGLWKGLVVQVFGLAGLILGYILSVKYYLKVAGLFPDINPGTARIAAFLTIFIACIISAYVLGRVLEKLLKIAGLGWANRIMGGLLGLAKGALIMTVIMVVLVAFLPSGSRVLRESITIPYLVGVTKIFGIAIPGEIKEKYKSRIELFQALHRSSDEGK